MNKTLWLIASLYAIVALHGMEQQGLLPRAGSDVFTEIVMSDDEHEAIAIEANESDHTQLSLMPDIKHKHENAKKCDWCSYLSCACCPVSCLAAMFVGIGACPCMCCIGCYVKARCYEEGDSKLPCIECCATRVHDHCLAACSRGIWCIGCSCCNVVCESLPCCCLERLCCCGATKRGYLAMQKVFGDELARRYARKSSNAESDSLLSPMQHIEMN
jgi:hypothetical protein